MLAHAPPFGAGKLSNSHLFSGEVSGAAVLARASIVVRLSTRLIWAKAGAFARPSAVTSPTRHCAETHQAPSLLRLQNKEIQHPI
jgi:hypothetical protein